MYMDKWLDLIRDQQSVIAGTVSEINSSPTTYKANSHRKQYIKEVDILIEIIEAFNKISKEYLQGLRDRCQSHVSM
jgi:hypothetical protein